MHLNVSINFKKYLNEKKIILPCAALCGFLLANTPIVAEAALLNQINLEYNEQFEVIAPPNYNDFNEMLNEFSAKALRRDWEVLNNPLVIDEDKYIEVNGFYKDLARSQQNQTKHTGWSINPLLHMQINAFLCTGDEKYLEEFVFWARYFFYVRMDNQGRINYEGEILPQWEREPQYDIFHVSPFKKYSKDEKYKIIKERGWHSLYFSDINYSGLIIEPILRFIQVISENRIFKYKEEAEFYLKEIEKNIASHEKEWIDLSDNSGYYIFPKNCPFYLDGVEVPVNEAAIFGSALIRCFMITNETRYLHRAIKMFNRWKKFMAKDKFGYINYPYFTGLPFLSGWSEKNSPSKNTPVFKPARTHEVFHKAALTVDFLILLEQAKQGIAEEYLKEFYVLIKAGSKRKNILSNFPASFGFSYPTDSYHTSSPTHYRGWLHLSAKDSDIINKMMPYLQEGNLFLLEQILYFQYLTEMPMNVFKMQGEKEAVSPKFWEESRDCFPLWTAPEDGLLLIEFKRLTPKHNVLYLYDYFDDRRKVRLRLNKAGKFVGKIYVEKSEIIDIRWKKSKHGAPSSSKENKVILTFFPTSPFFLRNQGF